MWHVTLFDFLRSNNSGRLKGNTKCQGCQELLKLIKEILCVIPIHIPWQNNREQQHREESFLLTDSFIRFQSPIVEYRAYACCSSHYYGIGNKCYIPDPEMRSYILVNTICGNLPLSTKHYILEFPKLPNTVTNRNNQLIDTHILNIKSL